MIRNDIPHRDVACGGQQAAIIIIYRVAQHVVVHVGLAARLQQPHLVLVAVFPEDLDGLLQPYFAAVEGQVLVDDLLHPCLDLLDVSLLHLAAVRLVELAEIAVGDGMLDFHLGLRADVLRGLAEQEAQGTAVHAAGAGVAQVEEFDVAVVVHAEAQALRDVVDLGRDNGIRAVEFEGREHLLEGSAFVEALGGAGVFAVDGKHGVIKRF